MAAIGADPEALEVLARGLRSASDELERAGRRIDGAVVRSGWSGPDAERFRRSWHTTHRRVLQEGSTRCRMLATRLDTHASEQRRASWNHSTYAVRSLLPASATEATVFRGTITGSVGLLSASLTGRLSISGSGERRRVTWTDERRGGVGVTVGSGGRARWNDMLLARGATAGASAAVESRVTRTWTVDRAELPALLLSLAVEQELSHSPMGLAGRSFSQGARFLDAVGDTVGIDIPDLSAAFSNPAVAPAERTEDLVGVVVGASGWAALLGAGGGAPHGVGGASAGGIAVGTAQEADHRSLVLEADGSAAAALLRSAPALVLSEDRMLDATTSLRVEVPVGDDTRRPVLVTVTRSDGDVEEVLRLGVDPAVAPAAAGAARRALQRLGAGDVAGAVASLKEFRPPGGAVQVDASTVLVHSGDAGAEVVGSAASVDLSGTVEHRTVVP